MTVIGFHGLPVTLIVFNSIKRVVELFHKIWDTVQNSVMNGIFNEECMAIPNEERKSFVICAIQNLLPFSTAKAKKLDNSSTDSAEQALLFVIRCTKIVSIHIGSHLLPHGVIVIACWNSF